MVEKPQIALKPVGAVSSYKKKERKKHICITKNELEKKIDELRSLKALKEETENELKALENEVIFYMKENNLTEEITNNAKVTYKSQSRTTLDRKKLEEDLGELETV